MVVCPPTRVGSVPFGPSVTLTPGAVSACETSLARFPNRCLSPCRPGVSRKACERVGSAGAGRVAQTPPRSSSSLLCHRPSGPAEACCGWCVGCVPRSYLRSSLRARRGHADGVSGGAFTRVWAPCFSRRDRAVDDIRWGLHRSACRQVVRGHRNHKNSVRRDTDVCLSPSSMCRCHTPAPSPSSRLTTKRSSEEFFGRKLLRPRPNTDRDHAPPDRHESPASRRHRNPFPRRMPHRVGGSPAPRKACRPPAGEGPTGGIVGVASPRDAVRPHTGAAPTEVSSA